MMTVTNPLTAAALAAEKMTDPLAKSQLLAELAGVQPLGDALKTLRQIPNLYEKQIALLQRNYQDFPADKTDQLLEVIGDNSLLTGRIALLMLESRNTAAAWELVRKANKPFESDQQRYRFLEKTLDSSIDHVRWLVGTFTDLPYKEWGLLLLAKRLAEDTEEHWKEAETIAESFAEPLKISWAFYEMSRNTRRTSGQKSRDWLVRSGEILEALPIELNKDEETEKQTIQLRIIGKASCLSGSDELGESLLEKSETAAAALTVPFQRLRQRYFLAKVLREAGQIDSVQNYLGAIDLTNFNGQDRSLLLVWAAEAGEERCWTAAVEAASQPEKGIAEQDQANRIAEILRRFVVRNEKRKRTDDPNVDAVNLSAEEFEEHYYSPFAAPDCGC